MEFVVFFFFFRECAVDKLIASHLLYTDYVMLFARCSILVAGNIKQLLGDFSTHAGLHFRCENSVIFFANCEKETIKDVTKIPKFVNKSFLQNTWACLCFLPSRE